MTAAQVVTWFFKEQKMMAELRDIFVCIKPTSLVYDKKIEDHFSSDGGWRRNLVPYTFVNLDFPTYINNMVSSSGFISLFERIVYDYLSAIKRKMNYQNYYEICEEIRNKYIPLERKWKYFASHNIYTDTIHVGDKYNFELYGKDAEIEITEIKVGGNFIRGKVKKDENHCIWLSSLRDENGKPINYNFYIRRKGITYNGANKQ